MADHYETHVKGKNAEEILAASHTADANVSPYLQVAAKIRSNQDLINALGKASEDSTRIGRRIIWLTVALTIAAVLQTVATGWDHLAWWIGHGFKFR